MTGQMPIPRQTGNLARSLDQKRINDQRGYVFADSKRANYAAAVHDGYGPFTDKKGRKHPGAKPRRFLGDAVKMKKEAILRRFDNNCKLAIRRAGR